MICNILFTSFFFLFNPASSVEIKGDSLTTVQKNGQSVILYQVGTKETIYSIARKYNLPPKSIIAINPEIENAGIKIGQKIFVPQGAARIKNSKPALQQVVEKEDGKIYHTVEKGQTLFSVSKRYNAPIEDLKQWNNLQGNELKEGTVIIVGNGGSANPGKNPETVAQTTRSNSGYEKMVEKGIAETFETPEGNAFHYAQHRTAPVGTIIKINKEGGQNSIFVRVTGKLPAEAGKQVIIRLSKIAFERLNAPDPKPFKVEISYLP